MAEYRVTVLEGYQHPPFRFDYWACKRLYFEARNVFLNDEEWRPWDKVPVDKVKDTVKALVHDYKESEDKQWFDFYLRSFKHVAPGEFEVVVAQEWLD